MSMLRMISATDLVAPSRVGSAKILRPVTLITESGEKVELSPMGAKWLRDVLSGLAPAWTKEQTQEGVDSLMTPLDAALVFGVTRQTIYTWQDQGKIGRINLQNVRYVPEADILKRKEKFEDAKRLRDEILALPTPSEEKLEAVAQKFSGLSRRLISRSKPIHK